MNAPEFRTTSDWMDIPVADVGEAVVAAIAAGRHQYAFFTSDFELCFVQEAVAKSDAISRSAPTLITITHEHVSPNAALGYAAVSGKPAVTVPHTDSGALHHGAAIPSAYRGGLPVLIWAGGGDPVSHEFACH